MTTAGFSTAVYTSVFGGFESIWPPLRANASHRHLAVTDSPVGIPGWEHVSPLGTASMPPRLANRRQKMLFHEDLSDVDFSVYLDANVRPIRSLEPLVAHFALTGADLGLYPHYARSSVRQELDACVRRAKIDHPETALAEYARYEQAGFPDRSGMWEGSVIIKNHNSKKLSLAMHEWWHLYSEFQTRDQFSLPFVIWKHDLTVADLDREPFGREHYFLRLQHSSEGRMNLLARYLQARSVENRGRRFTYEMFRAARRLRQKLVPST
jgi:Protein of unknown function (DUF616)